MSEILPQLANPIFATWCFIICMFTLCLQALVSLRKVPKVFKLTVTIINAVAWLFTAIACIGMLYTGWSTHVLIPLYCFMYIVRIFASFCISAVSLDLAARIILEK